MKTIRIGLVGAGLMGRELASAAARWIHLLDLDFEPQIVAVCDPDADRLGWFRGRVVDESETYRDHCSMLEQATLDAVYCAVPHHLHQEVYCDVLKAGKHLLGEKPFGIDRQANAAILAEIAARPGVVAACSSELPFWPGAQLAFDAARSGRLGRVIEVRASFSHSSDLDPLKPINWKRIAALNGEYGVLGDLGMHILHIPLRLGWAPTKVFALLSNIVPERPGPDGKLVPSDTWDNALLACARGDEVPMLFEVKRIAPGEMNTWKLEITGDKGCVRFSTKHPKTFWSLDYDRARPQSWMATDTGSTSVYPMITGSIFEFGFSDSVLQMLAAFCDEVVNGAEGMRGGFRCATVDETRLQHEVLTAALDSHYSGQAVGVPAPQR